MNKIIVTICLLLSGAFAALAQTATVTGTVSDATEPLIGATVKVEGTKIIGVTDIDGNFSLNGVDVKKGVLEVSYVGMETQRVPLKGQTHVEITLKESSELMEELVVIGYGTQKRANLTGAMSSVEAKAIERVPVANVGEAIVGRMPGVQITTADGSPDAEITVRVRGGGSITQDNQPLVLIDGFEGSLNDVPPSDVESIEVLKDASSTAIYGARGANGVVLVTTKKPSEGKATVSLNAYVKTSELSNKIDVMNPYDFIWANFERKGADNSFKNTFFGNFGNPYEWNIYTGYKGYDWQDNIFNSHPVSYSWDANISGGNDVIKYKLTYLNSSQPSVMPDNGLNQNSLNLNLNAKIFKFLRVEFRNRYLNKVVNGRGTEGISLLTAMREQPTYGLQDFTTTPKDNDIVDENTLESYTHYDPMEINSRFYRKRASDLNNLGGALNWTIIKGLTLRDEFTYETFRETDQSFTQAESDTYSRTHGSNLTEANTKRTKWQLTNVLNYNFDVKDVHDFQLMLGQEMKHSQTRKTSVRLAGFPENLEAEKAFNNFGLSTETVHNTSSYPSAVRVSSFFGRVNYGYDDRYLVTATLRTDGSSRFAKGHRWGWFPAAALAWRMSNEKFLRDVTWLTNLKLRLSIGESGNDRITDDLYMRLYKIGVASSGPGWNGENGQYFYEWNNSYPVNEDVTWEKTITRNIGLDYAFLKGKISGSLEFYWNTTKDLLLETAIPGDTGFQKLITNIGQTSNRGIEFNVNALVFENKDWSVSLNANIGWNKGKIDKLAGDEKFFYSKVSSGVDLNADDVFRYYVGQAMGNIYGYVADGFYTVDDFNYEIASNSKATYHLKDGVVDCSILNNGSCLPGDAKFKKLTPVDPNDEDTYKLSADDRKVIGNTTPKFQGGFGANATWKGIDLTLFFNFMCGFDVINLNKEKLATVQTSNGAYSNLPSEFTGMYRRFDELGNDLYNQPELYAAKNVDATTWNPRNHTKTFISTNCVEDGSFLRLNNITLGYTLPKKWTKAIGMSKCRFYFTGYNLFTFTNYSGYDPEVNIATGTTPNIDYNMYPRARTYTFGVQLQF